MTEIGFSLDWLRFTLPFDWLSEFGNSPPVWHGEDTQPCKPILSYNMGVENSLHRIYWHSEHPEFRVMVECSGQELSRTRKNGGTDDGIIRAAISEGAKFTRIDYAVDLFDTGGTPLDVKECYHTGQLATIAHSVSLVEKTSKEKSLGATVYIGSRQSERLLRIYDKGKQSKTELDWIRVELEMKGKRAEQFGHMMAKEGRDELGKSAIAELIEWSDIPWLESIWEGTNRLVDIDSIGRPETDRERWIRKVVVPVIENELESGSEWLYDTLAALLVTYEERHGHGPNIAPKPTV